MSDLAKKSLDELELRRQELQFLASEFAASGSDVPEAIVQEFTEVDRELDRRLAAEPRAR